jgi:hypothetical protein
MRFAAGAAEGQSLLAQLSVEVGRNQRAIRVRRSKTGKKFLALKVGYTANGLSIPESFDLAGLR